MSTDRDVTRIVRSWLHEDAHEDADRILSVVLDEVDTTPQRRPGWLARRFPPVNNAFKIVLAAAAVAAVVAAGIIFLPRDSGNFGGPGSVAPTRSATPAPSPTPLTGELTEDWGPLEPGIHEAGSPFLVPLTFTVPNGWEGKIGGPYLVDTGIIGKPIGLFYAIFDKVAVDPCQSATGFADLPGFADFPGASVDALVTALAEMPGIEVTDVSDASVDGYSGTQLTVTAPDSFAGCALGGEGYVIFQLPLGANVSMAVGQRFEISILDVAGTRLVIVVPNELVYTEADRAQVQAVFDSIQIEQ